MQRHINWLVNRLFFGKRLDFRKAIRELTGQTASILELDKLGKEVTRLISQTLGAKIVYLFVKKADNGDFVLNYSFPEVPLIGKLLFVHDSPILTRLKQGKYLTREELAILPEFGSLWEKKEKLLMPPKLSFSFRS